MRNESKFNLNQQKKLIAKLKLNPDASMKQRLKNMNVYFNFQLLSLFYFYLI